jgi:Flp pilus assembly protein TadD
VGVLVAVSALALVYAELSTPPSRAPAVAAVAPAPVVDAPASASGHAKLPLFDALKGAKGALLQKDAAGAIELLSPYADSSDADVHRLLGVAYAQLHRTADAAKHYREYLRLKPDAPDVAQVQNIIDAIN